mmetsp:Transcript_11593/g.14387  ORF Transcript_11593/g.14387 Transcript_11593/m.14387 type:complete len:580 (+) Transcript_11593:220-1959(+)|eukprot:CAMPEP_0172520604 /NCGR_PEP_ID=MMETSP1066-20121228/292105_1 /TAXON_ID=671091 /ORGANISM="Coscinodiscus wailesii, Strain CCMP2513" /LENGTH=579 /DNA_ID=CAMNT_0013303395 /DNA_START=206 /DNA_END=1945 /DNA_ORIENTATION=-
MAFQSNIYGFDFLRTEHTLSSSGNGANAASETADMTDQQLTATATATDHISTATTDLERQFDVIKFLQAHRSSGCLPPSVIYKSTGIDLSEGGNDEGVARMLSKNEKIRIEEVPDPENPSINILTFGYQAKFSNIHDKTGLLAQINRCKNGVSLRDLSDAYIGVERDLTELISAGDVLAVANPEAKDKTLFPRGESFLVELDGNLFVPELGSENGNGSNDAVDEGGVVVGGDQDNNNSTSDDSENDEEEKKESQNSKRPLTDDEIVMAAVKRSRLETIRKAHYDSCSIVGVDIDPRKQIRRGEAIWVAGQWFRVSSAVREGIPLSEQPARAQAPPSVVLMKNLSKKNDAEGYIKAFNNERLPVDTPLHPDTINNLKNAKVVREQYATLLHQLRSLHSKTPHGAPPAPSNLVFATTGAGAAGVAGGSAHHHSTSIMRKRPGSHRGDKTGNAAELAKKMAEAHKAANDPALHFSHARRHGCTKDVREMYLATRSDVPADETELFKLLIKVGLLEEGEAMRRKKMAKKTNVDNDGKPKKRRYYVRKNQKFMNTHLQGTEIGAALARAAEMQAQGKSVGDGGM